MIDNAKEFLGLEAALASMVGLRDGLELMLESAELRRDEHGSKVVNATAELLHLMEVRLQEAEHAAFALRHGKYCSDDPRATLKLVS